MTDKTAVNVADLIDDLFDACITGDVRTPVTSIAFDSRNVVPGTLFVALRGGYADGHDYLQAALRAGAVAALVEPDTPEDNVAGYKGVIRVRNTRGALAHLSAALYGHPSLSLAVIGITGTDGKTTTSFYLHQMLERAGLATGLISTVAVRVPGQPDRSSARQTTPESLDVQRTLRQMVDAGARVAVVETTSHALETHRVDNCHFDVGVVTNITSEHLDFHGSIENYRKAKAGLLRRVARARDSGKRGAVVLNADDPGCVAISSDAEGADILWYSTQEHSEAGVRAENIVALQDSNTFTLVIDGRRFPVRLPLPGAWNVANALAASGAAYLLGCDVATIANCIENLRPVPGRMESIDLGQPFTVVVDYAHTPESIRSVLEEARRITSGRVLVTFGSAGERDVEKRPVQGAVAARLADYAIFTSEDPRFEDPEQIINEIAAGATERGAVRGVDFDCIEDRREAVSELLRRARAGDIVILAGKGHERSMIYGSDHRPWDESQVARQVLQELGYGPAKHEGTEA